MKSFKSLLLILVVLVNLIFAQPSFAEYKASKNPDYIEVTKTLDRLAASPNPSAEVQKQIADLEFQKYTLEAGLNWGQCKNDTGKTIAVYGPKPDIDNYTYDNGLYFLADGQTTKSKWNCQGVYIPNDAKDSSLTTPTATPIADTTEPVATKLPNATKSLAEINKAQNTKSVSTEPATPDAVPANGAVVVKVPSGTKLIIKTNADGALEFSIPSVQILKSGEVNWFIPNVSQAVIDTRAANAPTTNS